jgi:hypothetical protein
MRSSYTQGEAMSESKSKIHVPSLDDLLRENPHIDAERLREALKVAEKLKQVSGGFVGTYRISSPFQSTPRLPAKEGRLRS